MINDVGRGFFHANIRREIYVQIADEDIQLRDERQYGKLNCSMYGPRDAAQNWAT